MPRVNGASKSDTFNFRVDADLKAAFTAAAESADRPAAQVLREFMRDYVSARSNARFRQEARRQSLLVAAAEADPDSDAAALQRELDAAFDDSDR